MTGLASVVERERLVCDVVELWRSAIGTREIDRIAGLFSRDAIFQGLHPYGVGRDAVAEYYASQPIGLKAAYRLVETRQVGQDAVLAYLEVEFSFTDRPSLRVHLSVLLVQETEGWLIKHYQVSRLD